MSLFNKLRNKWPKLKGPLEIKTVSLIPISIFLAKLLSIRFDKYKIEFSSSSFVTGFIEWFGVIYGILLPLILVRVWEQLDDIDREFDREADTIKSLYEDLFYLQGESSTFRVVTAELLRQYVIHEIENFRYEVKQESYVDNEPSNKFGQIIRLARGQISKFIIFEHRFSGSNEMRIAGERILEKIRIQYRSLIKNKFSLIKDYDPFISEIFQRLNEITDIRGDRIGFASQRLFQSLQIVALITSITFVLPFYFVGFAPNTPLLDNILIVSLTLLVIYIYMIIEDFDEPFGGVWRISDDSWKRVLEYMDEHDPELKKTDERNLFPEVIRRKWHKQSPNLIKRKLEKRKFRQLKLRQLENSLGDIKLRKKKASRKDA